MDVEKLRSLTDAELLHQQRELNDQLFRLKFQLKMGQTESLNKIRGLRKDVARIHTVMREKELGIVAAQSTASPRQGPPLAMRRRPWRQAQRRPPPARAPRRKTQTAAKGKTAKPAKKKSRNRQSEEEVNGRDNRTKRQAAAAPRLAGWFPPR